MSIQNKEIIDIEAYAKEGKKPPRENVIYRFRVGEVKAESDLPNILGSEILMKVGLDPATNRLYQKLHGGQRRAISLEQVVDLSEPGVERFETIPKDPTEG